ncbi:hypothetical protein DXG03_007501 [Asterophora parasitica]|uniref:G-patch domain-containing protein n=1 Tax=Asterophora parasitica TaxID=117018 RepID=A0A9P7GCP8_9AGAR|nr:hypothetical protein DXG03_007501 [Asterophora parasitica]
MSSRLKRKLGDLGVDTSSRRANESFCLIGTPLPPLEKSKDTGEFVPLWKQDVRDEKGRRRLHGAFTGGFSAGYFNTVGSKEGWAPSTFVSSRSDRAKQKTARPEDFMDEEDLQELKDSRNLVDTTEEMDLTGTGRGEPEDDSMASALQASLLPPPSDSAGARILKKMGWRMGQGIGPRVSLRKRRLQDIQLSHGSRVPTENAANIPEDDDEGSKHTYAPRDTPVLLVDRKDNSHGLGYNPGMGLHDSAAGGKAGASGPRLAAGFGLGALNDADEDDLDVYDGSASASHRRRVAYDSLDRDEDDTVTIGGKSERGKRAPAVKQPASASAVFFRDGQSVLAGFILSDKPVSEDRWYVAAISRVFVGWTPDPRRVWNKYNNKENIPGQHEPPKPTGGWDSKITADERGSMLGETPLPSAPRSVFEFMSKKDRERLQNIAATKGQPGGTSSAHPPPSSSSTAPTPPQAIKIPHTEPSIAQAALRGFQPFASDPHKQSRYNAYLQSQLNTEAAGPALQPLPRQRTDEFNKEVEDYAKAALLFKPMSGAMAGRFTSAAVVDHGPKIIEGLYTPSHEDIARKEEERRKEEEENVSPKAHAVRMGMYGPLTRETKGWQPAKLLCKRFKVRDPNPEPEVAVPPESAAHGANWQQPDIPMAASSTSNEGEAFGYGTSNGPRDIANIGLGEDENQGRETLTYERPAMDVFKAIFASDDEDSDDDEEKEEKEELVEEPQLHEPSTSTVSLPPTSTAAASSGPAPVDTGTGPLDLRSFKPTFIPREGKARKEKDKDKGRDKDNDKEKKEKKKRKREKEKERRPVLSFAMDEEGADEVSPVPKPTKDRPKKKKKQRKEEGGGEDEDGMWVEKPAAEAVRNLVLAPPPQMPREGENGASSGELSRGRKRAVDFL